MNPAFLDGMSWEMAEVYGAINDQILINLAKYFPYFQAGNVPKSAFTYQAAMLAQMGQVNRETVRIIRNGLKDASKALGNILEQTIIEAVRKAEKPLWKAVQKGIYMPPQTPVLSPNQYRAFQLYYKQAADKLNMVNTVMLESTQQAYRNTVSDIANRVQATQTAIDIGAGETITGVSTWNQAVKHSIDRMKENGITGFIDHGGHRWSAEAYTAMDIRTTMYNTSRAAVWETNQNFGNDLYSVSYHDGARPLCYPWQNKVISSTNNARVVTDLDGNQIQVYAQSDTSYGQHAGLFGINCKHYPTPFIPGVSVVDGQPQSEEENAKTYAESQQQRRLERKIREEKRDLMMLKAQNAPDEMIKAQRAKIRQTDDDIDAFCAETGRARRQSREGVYTQRDFPDAKTYDVTKFTNEQKDRIEKFYREGGAQKEFTAGQMTPNTPVVPTTPMPAPPDVPPATPDTSTAEVVKTAPAETGFVPAGTIQEAEAFAKGNFVDEKMWASQGVSLNGISVDSANLINQRLSEFYNTYNVDKFSSLVAPAGNTKLGKDIQGAHAGYNPVNKAMVVNRTSFKNPAKAIEDMAKEREFVADYLANPEKYSRLDKYTRKMLENSRESGRFSVATNLEEVLDHECGHALDKAMRKLDNYEAVIAHMDQYAPGISGYAQNSVQEYVAESFAAWRKGGIPVDPDLVSMFESMRR